MSETTIKSDAEKYFERIWFWLYTRDSLTQVKFMQEFPRGIDPVLEALREQALVSPWQPIDTAPKNTPILAFYRNSHGNGRTVRAVNYTARYVEVDDVDGYGVDYDPELDQGWLVAGWYEDIVNECEQAIVLEATPTHWMPLPDPPPG